MFQINICTELITYKNKQNQPNLNYNNKNLKNQQTYNFVNNQFIVKTTNSIFPQFVFEKKK